MTTNEGVADSRCHASAARRTSGPMVAAFLGPILAILGCVVLSACGGKGGSGSTTIKSVTISPASASVPINTTFSFTATVTLTDSTTSTTTSLTWEVNGVAGGNSTVGTIVASSTDQLVATYTAPPAVPTTSSGSGEQVGQVNITAVAQQTTSSSSSSSSSSSGTVTSNTAIVTVTVGLGLAVTPNSAIVPAGGSRQFSALLNSVQTGATWTLSSTAGGTLGSIDPTGLYTAPAFPPPGNSITITATATASDGTKVTATATVTIIYSDHSLSGPYAFSYTGNDASGFLAVAGSFVADGIGHIVSGVEDVQSFLNGVSTEVSISGTYSVGSDGRGTISITTSRGTETWEFTLTTNQHAQMIRFDDSVAAGGAIDQQSLNGLSNSLAVISGRYAFAVSGVDAKPNFNPLGMAGEFPTDGAGGIPNTNAILDVNDNGVSGGTITRGDTTLMGSYAFDSLFPGTGRGTITLESTTIGGSGRRFAFYTIGAVLNSSSTTVVAQLHIIEIDGVTFLAGDVYLARSAPGLAKANYVFTEGGSSSAGAYAAGGVFASDGISTTSNGVLDINNAGTYNNGPSLGSCSFTSDATTGRIDLQLCPSGAGVSEFAAYSTALGTVVMLELDSSAVTTGLAYQQCGPQSSGCAASPSLSAASAALGLGGQGLFHSPPATAASFQPDLDGRIQVSSSSVSSGNLDINNFSAVFPSDPLGTSGSSIGSPASNGRGTSTLAPTNPAATYKLVYLLIDDHTALLISTSQSPVAIGMLARQF